MYFGACYYPEHWPEERWAHDMAMMKEANFNIIRLAEFAWIKMEPEEGRFDFEWLDRAIELAEAHGMGVILGTPTAGPPKWLMDKHPDIYQKDIYGHARGFGARRHYCFNNATFRAYTRRIVEAMAARYGERASIAGWQIDNELGMIDTARCYCDNCLAAFKTWLEKRYGTIDAVNEAWGTIFSSGTFRNWDEVHLPAYAVHQEHNPGLQLDYRRFCSDSAKDYLMLQLRILREHAPTHPITTNEMGKYNHIDYYDLSAELDLCSLDIYPAMKRDRGAMARNSAAEHDMTRGYKRRHYWVLEHQSGTPGANVMAPTPKPGDLRRWTYQSVARGADAIVYFRWRTLNVSVEQYWHGILHHHGEPGRLYEEAKRTGEELRQLAPLLAGTKVRAKVAILRSYDNEWAFEIQPHKRGYDYMNHLMTYYGCLYDRGITVDILSPEADLTGYELVIAPNLKMAKDDTVEKLYAYVREGGKLVLDIRAGVKLWDNRMSQERLPGVYRELLGIVIDEYGILDDTCRNTFSIDGSPYQAENWYEMARLEGAEAVASFDADYYQGAPAVTRHRYGNGEAWYVATDSGPEGMDAIIDQIVGDDASLKSSGLRIVPAGVEIVERVSETDGRSKLLILINHNDEAAAIDCADGYLDVLGGNPIAGLYTLAPRDVLVLQDR